MNPAILQPNLSPMQPMLRGKVRDLYAVGDDALLFVATDRISAFDHVLATGISDKGKVLTQMSLFWFDYLRPIVANHLITADVTKYPAELAAHAEMLRGRSMLVKRAGMFPVECVARGYLSGSGWKEYQQNGAVCGIALPAGLRESEQLPEPIFTPAAKNHTGHDENISFDEVVKRLGAETAEKLRSLTLAIYKSASDYAREKGVILADTKFEFGVVNGEIILADEVLTPDSSRYWPAETYKPGGAQPSFDKQYVRDYLEQIKWNKEAPAPALPDEVVMYTREKYLSAYRMLTGRAGLAE
ncbi:MAG: phosphoribosylaminoimidazolesuccinocarboxamide synthase [Acidobacteria bacterium]|nr:phosphoribosylaminoimidazolesuccinocarboxamide synthase [Acidobacteriota bacterium]